MPPNPPSNSRLPQLAVWSGYGTANEKERNKRKREKEKKEDRRKKSNGCSLTFYNGYNFGC